MLQVLSSLWHEQGISQQILAERIAKDKACLTNLMNNLEKKGYVYRKEDPADRRNKLVFLTPEGEEFKDQIRPILDQVYVYAEKIIGIESIETMLSELKVYTMYLKCIKIWGSFVLPALGHFLHQRTNRFFVPYCRSAF